MITGLKPKRHGMMRNSWKPSIGYVKEHTVLSLLKQKGFKVAMFVGKGKLQYLAKPGTLDHFQVILSLDWGKQIASEASSYIMEEKPNFVFIHFPHPDLYGHRFGWLSERYMEAVQKTDEAIGIVLDGLKKAGMYDKTLILLTADHGGHGRRHGSSDPQDMTIPWIIYGPGIKKGYEIKKEVSVCDTAATILYSFGLNLPSGLDGRAVEEVFTDPGKTAESGPAQQRDCDAHLLIISDVEMFSTLVAMTTFPPLLSTISLPTTVSFVQSPPLTR